MSTNRGISHDEFVIKELKDPQIAAGYLSELLKDHTPGAQQRLLVGLHRMVKAHGMAATTERLGLSPAALYKALSPRGNPRLETLLGILHSLGLCLTAEPQRKAKPRKRAA